MHLGSRSLDDMMILDEDKMAAPCFARITYHYWQIFVGGMWAFQHVHAFLVCAHGCIRVRVCRYFVLRQFALFLERKRAPLLDFLWLKLLFDCLTSVALEEQSFASSFQLKRSFNCMSVCEASRK